jgi:hypothetical protein
MKVDHSKLWLALSLLLAMGCGARTPLDVEPDQSTSPVGGGATSQVGAAGGTVSFGTGGAVSFGGSGGFFTTGGAGGTIAFGTGGTVSFGTGGAVSFGGSGGFFTTRGTGGSVAFGGTVALGGTPTGGRTSLTGGTATFGGAGGTVPFGGGTIIGGRIVTGGTVPFGGTPTGGRTSVTGGTVPLGGTVVGGRGGTVPVGGTLLSGGSVVGGRGGTLATGGMGGTVGGTTCPGLAPNEEMIDDMNDGDRYIPQVNGRAGAWKDEGDATSSSTMFPDPAGLFTMTNTGDACRKYAAYVYGGPFVDGNPAFRFGIGGPYDASKYDGISFWAKIDSGSSSGLRVAFPDKDTQPDGGLCQASVPGNSCWDHYGKKIDITTAWTRYQVSFNELTQIGWGRAGAGFDRSTIYEVQFQLPSNAKFGVWIDDVALVIGRSN